jgi:hypothetical protein
LGRHGGGGDGCFGRRGGGKDIGVSMGCGGGYMMGVSYVIMNPQMYASRRIVGIVSEEGATCFSCQADVLIRVG